MVNYQFKLSPRKSKRNRSQRTIPNQSMTIQDILNKFTRNIPVNLIQRQAVYVDQNEYDLEQKSRMDFAEKAAFADELLDKAIGQEEEIKANERAKREKKQKLDDDQAQARQKQKQTGIDPLDNTMPVDTSLKTK